MTYREFQDYRIALLGSRPEVVDLCETNPWRALASLTPVLPDVRIEVHRRELAEAWLSVFGLPGNAAPRVLASSGVRHSLSLVFRRIADRSKRLLIPVDVYPVYGQLAHAAGVATETFPTIPEVQVPDRGDWLLLPNPLKPAGRWLSDGEVQQVLNWLQRRPDRRLLLDIVYTFERQLHPTTHTLLETGQTVLLHSLSKGWLQQQLFGVALVPQSELAELRPAFEAAPLDATKLKSAWRLLTNFANYPDCVGSEIRSRRENLLRYLSATFESGLAVPDSQHAAGYLTAVPLDSQVLLEQRGLLTAPLTIFGSPRTDYCVISALGFL